MIKISDLLAKKGLALQLKKTRFDIIQVIKGWKNPVEKQAMIDTFNQNVKPLTEEELNYINA